MKKKRIWQFIQMCVNRMPKRKDISTDLREDLLLSINLRWLIWPFPNNLNSVSSHKRLITCEKPSRQVPNFPGTSPQANTVQCSEKPKSYISESAGLSMLNVNVHNKLSTKKKKKYVLVVWVARRNLKLTLYLVFVK